MRRRKRKATGAIELTGLDAFALSNAVAGAPPRPSLYLRRSPPSPFRTLPRARCELFLVAHECFLRPIPDLRFCFVADMQTLLR
jgi:hypothetical protein